MAKVRSPGLASSPDKPEPSALVRVVVSALAGAWLGSAYTHLGSPLFAWFAVGVLIAMAIGARPRVAALGGFLNAIAFVLTCLFWIADVLKIHGGLSGAGGVGVLLLIAAAWGCLNGLFAWGVSRISRRSVTMACMAAPFLWVALEFARNHLPEIGFPWNLLGYPAASSLALAQVTTITGIWGLSFLVTTYNALFAWAGLAAKEYPLRVRLKVLAVATTLVLVVVIAGAQFVPRASASHTARAVQVNFPEVASYGNDWFHEHAGELDEIERMSLDVPPKRPDIIVWPEAPAPFSFQDSQFAKRASALGIRFGGPFLAGAIEWKPILDSSGRTRFAPYNSAILLDAQGQLVFGYAKMHLVPFGEYEPFPLIHRVVAHLSDEVGGFRPGTNRAVGTLPGSGQFGVFICYEAIFPGEIRQFAAKGAQVFFNISNDGWFGRSVAPEQHLEMARIRAVENRRWLVRVTNNGYTVSVDPYGRIVARLAPDVRAAADLPYDFRSDQTPYTRWGDWFAWLCVGVSIVSLAVGLRRKSD